MRKEEENILDFAERIDKYINKEDANKIITNLLSKYNGKIHPIAEIAYDVFDELISSKFLKLG